MWCINLWSQWSSQGQSIQRGVSKYLLNEWMDEWVGGWMDGWVAELILEYSPVFPLHF